MGISLFVDTLFLFMSYFPSSMLSGQYPKGSRQSDHSGCYTLMFSGSALTLFGISQLFK